MPNQSNAYNFELFEPNRQLEQPKPPQKSNVIELPKEKLEQNRKPKLRPIRAATVVVSFAVLVGIVGTYVNGQVQLSEVSDQLSTTEKLLQEQQNVYSQLKLKSDAKLSMQAVETYATQKLGMQKTSRSQVTAVELSKGDKSEVVTKSSGKSWLERAWEAVKGFLS